MELAKQVIITGGTGFIGANLVRRLLREGHKVHLLVRKTYNPWRIESIRNQITLHEADFLDNESLIHVVNNIRPDWIFHLAVYGAYSWQVNLRKMVETNILSTINLVDACLKVGFEVFVNTGTSSEYGFKDYAPSEKEHLDPNSHYAVTKACATMFCRYTALSHKVRIYTLRLYSAYGPYEDSRRLIPTLIRYGLKGKFPPLVDADAAHDFVYIDDISEAYIVAATTVNKEPGAIYNVGTAVQTSMRQVVGVVQRVMGVKVKPKWGSMPSHQWDTNIWVVDNRKIKEQLGWQPKYTFEQGFRATFDWFRSNATEKDFYLRRKARIDED